MWTLESTFPGNEVDLSTLTNPIVRTRRCTIKSRCEPINWVEFCTVAWHLIETGYRDVTPSIIINVIWACKLFTMRNKQIRCQTKQVGIRWFWNDRRAAVLLETEYCHKELGDLDIRLKREHVKLDCEWISHVHPCVLRKEISVHDQ